MLHGCSPRVRAFADFVASEIAGSRAGVRHITLAQLRRAAINASLQPPHSAAVPTINPSCCCLPVALLLAPRRIAHTFGVSQIPIAKAAAPPPTTARGFVPWRLSDAGQRVRGSVDHRRHPKPCTGADIADIWPVLQST